MSYSSGGGAPPPPPRRQQQQQRNEDGGSTSFSNDNASDLNSSRFGSAAVDDGRKLVRKKHGHEGALEVGKEETAVL